MGPAGMRTSQSSERRGQALRISTVLAGLLHLVLAGLLIAIPGSSPTLDALPVPEGDKERARRPVAALSPRPATSPVEHPAPPRRATVPGTSAPPATPEPTPTPTPAPLRGTRDVPPVAGRTSPPRVVSKAAPKTPPPTRRPTPRPTRTTAPEPGPTSEHTPPGQTREPPGLGGRTDGPVNEPVNEHADEHAAQPPATPPGQARK
ncbi:MULTISPECIES: hypothetical protein [unclassified Nonomuraea]|uniref:hypothetical protein n=1 Tax=unclassified Nonomuraea TaxID=2593643 RepID=UPI0035C239D5